MREAILITTDPTTYDYLKHVIESHAPGGVPGSELALAASAYQAIMSATRVPTEPVTAKVTDLEPGKIGIEIER